MRKQIVFIFGIFIALLLLGILLLSKSTKKLPLFNYLPTPTSVEQAKTIPSSSVHLLSITPTNGAKNVPVIQTITAVFDKTISHVSFNIYPDIPFTYDSSNNTLRISFSQNLDSNITYSYTFLDFEGNLISSGDFSTGNASNSVAPLSGEYPNLQQNADAAQKQTYPDVFLANYIPYDSNTFSVEDSFDNIDGGRFVFTVTSKSFSGKSDFLQWLSSLGLSNQQIQQLIITYK